MSQATRFFFIHKVLLFVIFRNWSQVCHQSTKRTGRKLSALGLNIFRSMNLSCRTWSLLAWALTSPASPARPSEESDQSNNEGCANSFVFPRRLSQFDWNHVNYV